MAKNDLQGSLDLLILKTLSQKGDLHGYGIVLHIQRASEDLLSVEEGSLYPALHRMEQSGWVTSQWALSETNRKAKFYKLTAAGLVERRDDATDRRIHRLYLTEKAAPKLAKLGALGEAIMEKALDGLDEGSVSAMRQGLDRIKANLKTELNSGV